MGRRGGSEASTVAPRSTRECRESRCSRRSFALTRPATLAQDELHLSEVDDAERVELGEAIERASFESERKLLEIAQQELGAIAKRASS